MPPSDPLPIGPASGGFAPDATNDLRKRRLPLDRGRVDRVDRIGVVELWQMVHVRDHDLVDHRAERARACVAHQRAVGDELERVARELELGALHGRQ